jgi:hypothetical protein
MTILSVCLFLFGCGLVAFAGWAIIRGGAMRPSPAPPVPAKVKRVYIRGLCPYCGEIDVVLRQDGEPSRRHHPCRLASGITLARDEVSS